jgi:exonuclease III
MVKEKKPSFLFLMETISRKNKMEWIRVKFGFAGMFVIDPVGRSGGLELFWKETDELEIQNFSRRHINAIVKRSDEDRSWKLTCFYGNPDSSKRHESWALLKHLSMFLPEPWLCVGDFNEITYQEEKTGEARRREGQMASFRSALEDCYLTNLGYHGPRYTWSNKRTDGTVTRVRLDRAMATSTWCKHHRSMEVCVLVARSSDHNPVMVVFDKREKRSRGGSRGFKFEDKWWLDLDCSEIIK